MARSLASASSQYVERTTFPQAALPCTIAAWFRVTSIGGSLFQRVATWSDLSTANVAASIIVNFPLDGSVSNQVNPPNQLPSKSGVTANTWHHACSVSETTAARIYLDGVAGGDVTYSTPTFGTATYFTLGKVSSVQYLDGAVAHVAVWNVSLNAAEAAALAAGVSPLLVRPASLIAYYPLGGFHGDNDNDLVGGYHLTPYNSPTFTDQRPIIYPHGPAAVILGGDGVSYVTGSCSVSLSLSSSVIGLLTASGSSSLGFHVSSSAITGLGAVVATTSLSFSSVAATVGVGVIAGSSLTSFLATSEVVSFGTVSGSAAFSFYGSGLLVGLADLSAAFGLTFGSSALITGIAETSGSTGFSFSIVTDLSLVGELAGTTNLSYSASANLLGIAESSGSSTFGFSLTSTIVGTSVLSGISTFSFVLHAHPDQGVPWIADCSPDSLILVLECVTITELTLFLRCDLVMLDPSANQLRTGWYDG